MLSAADLPNDIEMLEAMLLMRDEIIIGREAQVDTGAAEIEHLKLIIAKLRRMQFGRKSEKLDHQIEQLELQLEDLLADEAEGRARCRRPTRRRARNRCANRCRNTCRATRKSTCRQAMLALPPAAVCATWARTSPNNWNMCRPTSA